MRVHPVRPECKHYLRQLIPPPEGTVGLKFGQMQRFCMLRRTLTGAFMSLTDEAMRACGQREPIDAKTTELMDEMDEIKIRQGRERVMLPMFAGGGVEPGSIFDPAKENN